MELKKLVMFRWHGEPLILASASPRRSDMLLACNIPFEKIPADCDESPLANETAELMVDRLSKLKAQTIAERSPLRWVLGADTTVVIEGKILGKPANREEAIAMLSMIQGRTHTVVGGFTVGRFSDQRWESVVSVSRVTIRPLTHQMIVSYVATGEPLDKAGSYAIQGIGAALVEKVEGSYSNVVGLDLSSVMHIFERLGVVSF